MSTSVTVAHPMAQSAPLKRGREMDADGPVAKRITGTKAVPVQKPGSVESPEKVYNESIKAVEKDIKTLDKRVRNQKWPAMNDVWSAITTDNYAAASTKHLGAVEKLASMEGGLPFAFNLTMALAEACHTNMDVTAKISGWGNSILSFERLDAALKELIQRREQPEVELERVPWVRARWTRDKADVGVFKTGRPNKHQRDMMDRQEAEWKEGRRKERRTRREMTGDWVFVAPAELEEQRDYLDRYGVDGYFPESIAALEELLGDEASVEDASGGDDEKDGTDGDEVGDDADGDGGDDVE